MTELKQSAALLTGMLCVCLFSSQATDWIDLGNEGATLYATVDLTIPPKGSPCTVSLATGSGLRRVTFGIGAKSEYVLWLYQKGVSGSQAKPGEKVTLVLRVNSHRGKPDRACLAVLPTAAGLPRAEPSTWILVNAEGASDANLSALIVDPDSAAHLVSNVHVAGSWTQLRESPMLDEEIQRGDPVPDLSSPHPVDNPDSGLMLDLPGTGQDQRMIDYDSLPRLPGEHAVISTGTSDWQFRLHEYLAWHDGRYWCVWSHGPVIEDRARQHVQYATSSDGLNWTVHGPVVGPPREGFGYIARGLWIRNGELIALASLYQAPGYPGPGLSLKAFRWITEENRWEPAGTVLDDTLNNFPPKRLPNGRWLMSRRDGQQNVSMITGGVESLSDWAITPLADYRKQPGKRPEEPYWYILPDGQNLVGLFRNNAGKTLLRAFSTNNGTTWSQLTATNFPDATSKFFVVHTSTGYYALISNANPAARNPLCLSVSRDGLIYTNMAILPIPSDGRDSLQYPHVIEHDGHLLVVFSRRKRTVEAMKIPLAAVARLLPSETRQ